MESFSWFTVLRFSLAWNFSPVNGTFMWIFSSYFPEEWTCLDENGLQWNSIALKIEMIEIYELRQRSERFNHEMRRWKLFYVWGNREMFDMFWNNNIFSSKAVFLAVINEMNQSFSSFWHVKFRLLFLSIFVFNC